MIHTPLHSPYTQTHHTATRVVPLRGHGKGRYCEEGTSHSYVTSLSMANEVNRFERLITPMRVDKKHQYTPGWPRDLPVRGAGYEPSTS